MSKVIIPFRKIFRVFKEEEGIYIYLGIDLNQKGTSILITQKDYSHSIEDIVIYSEQMKDKNRLAKKKNVSKQL